MKKKLSLIIGGSKGIGNTISQYLSKRGDKVLILSRNVSKLKSNIQADITNQEKLKLILNKKFKSSKIDNVIFSQRYRGDIQSEHFETDLFSTINVLSILKKKLKKNASIILISSISNRTIVDEQTLDYHVIRSGIEQMMRFCAVKFSSKGIRFNCILPSKIIKNSNKKFFFKEKKGIQVRKLIESITPLGRMGTSKDVANLALFLTNKQSEYVTGQSFIVDGGLSLVSQESILNTLKKKKKLF